MNPAVKPFTNPRLEPTLPPPALRVGGIAQRLSALFDDWCEVVAPCPWTATAGRRAIHAQPLNPSRP
jgi:hypothetical protein